MPYGQLVIRVRKWAEGNGIMLSEGSSGWLHKLTEEVGELNGAYVKDKPRADEEGEVADVLICLLLYAEGRGIDVLAVAHDKMTVNESRKGHANRHGVFVKQADL